MENLGENNSQYFFKFKHQVENSCVCFGVAPELQDLNADNTNNKDCIHLDCGDGKVWDGNNWNKYFFKVA